MNIVAAFTVSEKSSNTYSFLITFSDCSFGNGRIDHLTELLNDLLNRYYKYWQNMWLSWPKI